MDTWIQSSLNLGMTRFVMCPWSISWTHNDHTMDTFAGFSWTQNNSSWTQKRASWTHLTELWTQSYFSGGL
jgi:hypothetical protein